MTIQHTVQSVGAPQVAPPSVGAHYIDTESGAHYLAKGVETAQDWVLQLTKSAADAAYQPKGNYATSSEIDALVEGKLDAPLLAGTSGQVLSLDAGLAPVWKTPEAGSGGDGGGSSPQGEIVTIFTGMSLDSGAYLFPPPTPPAYIGQRATHIDSWYSASWIALGYDETDMAWVRSQLPLNGAVRLALSGYDQSVVLDAVHPFASCHSYADQMVTFFITLPPLGVPDEYDFKSLPVKAVLPAHGREAPVRIVLSPSVESNINNATLSIHGPNTTDITAEIVDGTVTIALETGANYLLEVDWHQYYDEYDEVDINEIFITAFPMYDHFTAIEPTMQS